MTITDALNTYDIAIHMLTTLGVTVALDKESDEFIMKATQGDFVIVSFDPLSLLSLYHIKRERLVLEDYRRDFNFGDQNAIVINLLIQKGYELNIVKCVDWHDWVAKKNNAEIYASSPLKLFGLSLVIEKYGVEWSQQLVPPYMQLLEE